jgi:hypothetical protein
MFYLMRFDLIEADLVRRGHLNNTGRGGGSTKCHIDFFAPFDILL